ncbi:MAG TPA: hypothetical protein VGC41_17530 [Kofleriaceae bacterium]
MRFLLLLAALVPACKAAEAQRPESRTTVIGQAQFPGELPTTHDGTLRLTIRGTAEVSDDCRVSGDQAFVATYDGGLTVQPNGQFNAALAPSGIQLANGCNANQIRNLAISSIELGAQLGDEYGAGSLTYQNLSAIDGDELRTGSFDELAGELTFNRQ